MSSQQICASALVALAVRNAPGLRRGVAVSGPGAGWPVDGWLPVSAIARASSVRSTGDLWSPATPAVRPALSVHGHRRPMLLIKKK